MGEASYRGGILIATLWRVKAPKAPRLPTELDARTDDELSLLAEKVAKFPQHKRDQIFAGYTQADYASLNFDWNFWGRPEQIAPPGTWDNWLILAGRGFGTTRAAAECIRANMCGDTSLTGGRWRHVALIAETAADARDIVVGDGKMASDPTAGSGILQVHPKDPAAV